MVQIGVEIYPWSINVEIRGDQKISPRREKLLASNESESMILFGGRAAQIS
jgi:hypothetical protein